MISQNEINNVYDSTYVIILQHITTINQGKIVRSLNMPSLRHNISVITYIYIRKPFTMAVVMNTFIDVTMWHKTVLSPQWDTCKKGSLYCISSQSV